MRGANKLAMAVVLAMAGSASAALAQSAASEGNGYPAGQETYPSQTGTVFGQPETAFEPATLPVLDWAVGLGYEHTDNVNRVSVDPVNQDILQPTLNFTYRQQGSAIQAQVTGLIQYTDYLQGFYDNDIFGQLSGQMNWVISPKRLNFDIEDYASVQPVNTRVSNAPSNLQQVNVFVAGPTLTFLMGDALAGEADLRYINSTASKSKNYDSQRGMGAFRVIRNLTPIDTLSGNVQATHVDFNNVDPLAGTSNYNKYDVYLQYQRILTHLNLNLALGASRIDFSQGASNRSGGYVQASATWHASARTSLALGATSQITDSTANLAQSPNLATITLTNPNLQVGSSVITPSVYRENSLNLGYAYLGPRFTFNLSSYYTRLRPLNTTGDVARNGYVVTAGAAYLIQPLLTLGATASYQVTEYISDHSRDRDPAFSIYLSREMTPHWSWSVTLAHNGRLTTMPGLGYQENQLFAILYYRR